MIGIFINLWNRLTGGGTPAPTPALLDEYGGAAAAFSLRKLSSTYGGSAVRVRRSLDNTEQDIGFSGDNLDETALQAFVGYENLFARSEEFENAIWVKQASTITPNAGTDPLGGNNAERWLSNVGSTTHYNLQNILLTSGQSYTLSIWVRSNTGSNQLFRLLGCDAITSPNLTATTSWQRFTFTFVAAPSQGHGLLRPLDNAAVDLLIFGAQLNQGVTAQPYQQTIATANTANGFVTRWYTQDGNGENLLLQSQTFQGGSWTKNELSVSVDTTTSPDGTLTADKIIPSTTNAAHYIIQTFFKSTTSITYTFSAYVKASGYSYGAVAVVGDSILNQAQCLFDLVNETTSTTTVGTGFTSLSSSISNAGNGWYRISLTFISNTSNQVQPYVRVDQSSTVDTYAGDGTSGLFLWGAQLSQSSWLQPYQATTTTRILRRDASQATAASQPRIVNAGVIERENGKPAVYFNGTSGTELKTTYNVPTNASTFLATFRRYSASGATIEGMFNADGGGGGIGYSGFTPNAIQLDGDGAGVTNTAILTNNLLAHYIMSGLYTGSTTSGTSLFANGYYTNTYTGVGVSRMSTPLAIGGRTGGGQLTRVMRGTVQEGVLYNSNMLSSITAMNLNQNSYYQVYWQGTQQALLDQFGGSAAAFSLRNLSSSYRGPLVRVRRSSDNAETDIGGTFGGDLDVNSLLAFTGGQNLLAYSEDFATVFTKIGTTVTGNATIAPDGTLTADKLTETTSNGFHVVNQATTVGALSQYGFSVYLKAAERSKAAIIWYFSGTFDSILAFVDLSNGSIYKTESSVSGSVTSASVINVGNGWYRCFISGNTGKTGGHVVQVDMVNNSWQRSYQGVAGSGVYIWGVQLNTGSVLQPYIPTTTAAINGANAFVTKWYDQSGIGDNLVLHSEDFTNAAWLGAGLTKTANTITAPDGTLTADSINETATNGQHTTFQSVSVSALGPLTASVYLKAKERIYANVSIATGSSAGTRVGVMVDLQNGTIIKTDTLSSPTGVSSSISNAGNGWYRVSVSLNATTTGPASNFIVMSPSDSANPSYLAGTLDPIYLGVAGSGVYVWGAQVSLGSELLRYQPTTTAIAPKRDAVQTTASQQPQIANSGSVISVNAKPTLQFTNTNNQWLNIGVPIWTYTGDSTLFHVSRNRNSAASQFGSVVSQYSTVNSSLGIQWQRFPDAGTRASTDVFSPGGMATVNEQTLDVQHVSTFQWRDWSTHKTNGNTIIAINGANQGLTPYGTNPTGLDAANVKIGSFDGSTSGPAGNFLGDIQELVIYQNALSLSGIDGGEGNINSYYNVYWQGNGTALLDSYSGASAAYSLRNLSSAYTGPLIRVRRSSDNLERDIYGTFRGDLDLAALTSFVGANSGFVTTWYDQSGTGRHATQATAASQPRIVNAGAVETEGGKPSINFIGGSAVLISNGSITGGSFTSFAVYRHQSTTNQNAYTLYFGGLYTQIVDYNANLSFIRTSNNAVTSYNSGTSIVTRQLRSFTYQNSFLFSDYRNNSLVYSNNLGLPAYVPSSLRMAEYDPSIGQDVILQELIFFATDSSSIRTAAETNINNYYKIY
jgi:hypothetical protein